MTEIPMTTTVRLRVVSRSGQLTFFASEIVSRTIRLTASVRVAKTLGGAAAAPFVLSPAGLAGRAGAGEPEGGGGDFLGSTVAAPACALLPVRRWALMACILP